MDKRTEEEIRELKDRISQQEKELGKIKSWSNYACKIIVKVVTKLLLVGGAALYTGFHLPENIRKWLVSRLSE